MKERPIPMTPSQRKVWWVLERMADERGNPLISGVPELAARSKVSTRSTERALGTFRNAALIQTRPHAGRTLILLRHLRITSPLGVIPPTDDRPATVSKITNIRRPAGPSNLPQIENPVEARPAGAMKPTPPNIADGDPAMQCLKHQAYLKLSTRVGALNTPGNWYYCPSKADGSYCSFLWHNRLGTVLSPDDPNGQVNHDEFENLYYHGQRHKPHQSDNRTGYVDEVRKLYNGKLPWES